MSELHGFYAVRVAALRSETEDAVSVELAIPDGLGTIFAYRAGQFVSVRIPLPGGEIVRSYSLSSSPACDGTPSITVRREPGGRGSGWIHDHLRPGDWLSISPPQGRFVVAEGAAPVCLIAAGSGITPCFSMIRTLLATSDRRIHLLYASKTLETAIFREALQALASGAPERFSCRLHLSNDHGPQARPAFFGQLKSVPDAHYYVCGSPAFVEDVTAHLGRAGVDDGTIWHEAFCSPQDDRAEPGADPGPVVASLRLTLDGTETVIPVGAGQVLLDAALASGADVPHSCRSGQCGSCMAKLRSGAVDQKPGAKGLSRRDSEKGMVLACQSRAASAEIWLDYDF